MPDITMCTNEECPLKKSCYRFMGIPSQWQSFSHFSGGENCEAYILLVPGDRVRPYDNPWDKEKFNNNTNY
jgi:hypothetical protein